MRKIKKNDMVLVMIGKDRGKKGKIIQVLPRENKVVVEGINEKIRHLKARRGREKGERIKFNAPIALSNVMLLCPKCDKPTRVGISVQNNDKKRFCKKCKALI